MIDIHTHFMPQRVLDKVWAYFDATGVWPITYRFAEEERYATLKSFGVTHFTSLNYPHKPGMAAWLNDWNAEFAAAHPDCLHSATFFPEPSAPAYVKDALAAGARVFKAHVQVGAYDPNDPLLDGVWSLLEETGTPIVIHSGDGPAPGRFTGPASTRSLLERHPGLTLVIAHLGMPDYAEFLDLAEEYDRVHLDTTMAFTSYVEATMPFPPSQRPRLLELADKILWGSDFPNIPYTYESAMAAVRDLGLGETFDRKVFHDNAARLLTL